MKPFPLIAIFCSLAFHLEAQSITGKVVDSKTSEAIPFVNTFLNNTTIGTVTDANGKFNLTAIKATGTYELVFSFIGYDTYKTKVIVGDETLNLGTIKLIPSAIQLGAVEVTASRDKTWERKLKKFKNSFLGEDDLAAGCTIMNPWVIDFPPDNIGRKFIAKASAPIEIENRSLGYKIIFYLSDYWHDGKDFSIIGNVLFTEIKNIDAAEFAKWDKNRNRSYHRSINGLFKSIIGHRINGEGFRLYATQGLGQTITRYDTTALVTVEPDTDSYKIILRGRVEVHRLKKAGDYPGLSGLAGWIRLNNNVVIVNKYGVPKNPGDVEVSGDMSQVRVAGLLPLDYQPSMEKYQIRLVKDGIEPLTPLASLVKKADDHSENHRTEKVFLHFDKPYYFLGEESWYKAYVVTGSNLNPTEISSVLYLDWLDPSGKLIRHQRLRIEKGSATGDFTIDAAFPAGTYTVRAYTNWMRNEEPELFYSKRISVSDPRSTQSGLPKQSSQPKIDIQFFPEGGRLVPEIKTEVAFKAIDDKGIGVEVDGNIIDEQNHTITTFKSTHNGMGIFSLIPTSDKSYHAVLRNGQTYPLPVPSGNLALAVSNINPNKIIVRIQSSKEYKSPDAFLVGYSHGAICYAAAVKMNNALKDIAISKDDLPEGVLRLTLFNDQLIPQCERMLFIRKDNDMVVAIKSDKEQYGSRDSIILDLKINGHDGNAVQTSLSISVTDADLVSADVNSENIYTRLLLQSDIKGMVENPGWYFQSRSTEKTYALDLVMRTHGWSRYNWERILNPKTDSMTFLPETGITLGGQILNKNKPVPKRSFVLTAPQSGGNFVNVYESDSLGHFTVPGLDFSDSTIFSWQLMNEKKSTLQNAEIQLDSARDIPPIILKGTLYQTLPTGNNQLLEKSIAKSDRIGLWHLEKPIILDEVVVKAQRMQIKAVAGNTIAVKPDAQELKYGVSTATFIGRYALGLPFAILKEMKDGTQVWGSMHPWGFAPFNITIDGVTVETTGLLGNPDMILGAIPIDQIEQVYVSGSSSISVWTKNTVAQNGLAAIKRKVRGYDVAREFYHPRYGPLDIPSSRPDNRITLYWNANLQTDEEGKASAKFYNTDTTRKLFVVVQGIANGQVVSAFKVLGKE